MKNRTITRDEFYHATAMLLQDALAHLETRQGKDWKNSGMPDYARRLVKIQPRRDIGKTYTACRLAVKFMPALLVFANQPLLRRAIRDGERYGYPPTPEDYAFTSDEMRSWSFLPALGSPYMKRITPPHFEVGIIEDAGSIVSFQGERVLEETRDIMFQCCTIVLELG